MWTIVRALCVLLLVACSSSGGPGLTGGDGGSSRDGGSLRPDGGIAGRDGGAPDGGGTTDGGAAQDGGPADGGAEVGQPCGSPGCSGTQILICGENGLYAAGEDCAIRRMRCEHGTCVGCLPGTRRCASQTAVEACNDDGLTYGVVEVCGTDRTCSEGQCVTGASGPCGAGGKNNQGCDYWAVDLPNADVAPRAGAISPANAQFAVVISNTDETQPAQVLITQADVTGPVTVVTDTVPPKDLKVFPLGPRNADQCGVSLGCSHVGYKAFRVQTTIPVVAYQFNPLNNTAEAFSNDASLLLPTNALDTEYLVITADAQAGQSRLGAIVPWGAFVSVVGTLDTATSVTITIPSGVIFDPPQGATTNGQTITATLQKYQVLTVLSRPPASELSTTGLPVAGGGNLSGARVSASARVAVFSGNMAVVMPHGPGQKCCADHTEEQMFPLSAWGQEYVAARSLPRRQTGTLEEDYWRVTASQDGTTFTYVTNASSGLTGQPTSLNAGQSREFRSRGDFIVTANHPFLLAQFMASSNITYDLGSFGENAIPCTPNAGSDADDQYCTQQYHTLSRCATDSLGMGICQPIGDPSMTLIPPVRQFRRSYVFLTPLDYKTDFAILIAPQGTAVTLDGAPVPANSWQAVGALGAVTYVRARVVLTTRGRHVLSADQPVGLLVGGYDRDVSYGYPGGLNLEGATAADGGT